MNFVDAKTEQKAERRTLTAEGKVDTNKLIEILL
jgi:hypothetical protein